MKSSNVFFVLICVIGLAVSGCKKSGLDIQVSELNTPCDFVDALNLLLDEAIEVKGDAKSPEEMSPEVLSKFGALKTKLEEVDEAAGDKFPKSEAEGCAGFEDMQKKGEQMDDWFR
ncbi:MAG: hypothetical protein RLZZ519_1304 [Bacteroidota bacterium]|jgi:hypothetical protein